VFFTYQFKKIFNSVVCSYIFAFSIHLYFFLKYLSSIIVKLIGTQLMRYQDTQFTIRIDSRVRRHVSFLHILLLLFFYFIILFKLSQFTNRNFDDLALLAPHHICGVSICIHEKRDKYLDICM